MKIHLHPSFLSLRPAVEQIIARFDTNGDWLYRGRNLLKTVEIDHEKYVIKQFRQPSLFRRILYSFFRRTKARRSYEHANRLGLLGFHTPQPLAWIENRSHHLLTDSYYLCAYSEGTTLSEATRQINDPQMREVLDAFAAYVVRLHESGIEHLDFNQNNILYQRNPTTGEIEFELIDINRMNFSDKPLRPHRCMVNLRRLACPAPAFLYILDRYANLRGWDINDTLLRGTFLRLAFGRQKEIRKKFKAIKRRK